MTRDTAVWIFFFNNQPGKDVKQEEKEETDQPNETVYEKVKTITI